MNRKQTLEALAAEATEWRRELHRHPQTSYEETFASDFVAKKLTEWGIPHVRGIAVTGIVATIEGKRNHSGRAIAFRADMDALDLTELSGQPWASETKGKMHGCGHDGHTATLLLLAKYLNETRNFDGLVRLLFQPAEEGGGGAYRMLAEGLLNKFPFDEVYGYHNWPWLPRGTFSIRSGAFLAAADCFEITLHGRGGHAAMPHGTLDPLPAAASLALGLQTLVSREADPLASAVVSITNLNAGTGAFNVIPDTATLTGTVRTFRKELRDHIETRMHTMVQATAAMHRLQSAELKYSRIISPVINDAEATEFCREAARTVAGEANLREAEPTMGGEDFGGFTDVRQGAFILLGQGEADPNSPHSAGVHSPRYDFNDAILPTAAEYFAELAERRLPID
jgi:hippurate hydrolase